MKVKFDKRKIADTCTYLAFVLILVIIFFAILAISDAIFGWNILSQQIQRLAYLLIWSCAVVILGTFVISLMVNLSIISHSIEKLAEKNSETEKSNQND